MSAEFDGGALDLEAAEYVIGTLDEAERETFSERLRVDPQVQRAVAGWEGRLAGLIGYAGSMAPPADVWISIERSLKAQTATMHPFKVIDGGGGHSGEAHGLRVSRDRWRLGALLSGAIAAGLVLFVADRTIRSGAEKPSAGATYVAAVNRGGDKPALIVRVDLKTGQVLVRPVDAVAPEGKSLELWYIGDDKKPRSMGLVDKAPSQLSIPEGSGTDAATFAVSVEPPGGSKTGGPTGPVVYAGQLVKE